MVATEEASSEPRLENIKHCCDNDYITSLNINTKSACLSRSLKDGANDNINVGGAIDLEGSAEYLDNNNIPHARVPFLTERKVDETNMAIWSSKSGFREDINNFQYVEQRKTIVRRNLKFHATLLFALAVLAASLTIIDTQVSLNLREQNKYILDATRNVSKFNLSKNVLQKEREKAKMFTAVDIGLKAAISVLSIITCAALYFYYRNIFNLKIIRHFYPPTMSITRASPLFKNYIIECFICMLHVPPFLTTHAGFPPRLQLVVLLRLYLLGRYLKEKHELMNSQSTRFLASVTKTELTSMFLFKTFFMQYPFQLILLAYIILLFIGGYTVWILEQRYTYLDTVWMLIITMTTVGFGDLTPKTVPGRFAVGLAAIVGIFLMALFISLVNEALMLQRREKRILSYVENQDHHRQRKTAALNAIGMWFKYYSFVRKHFPLFDSTAQPLIGQKEERVKSSMFAVARRKFLETQMFKAINHWRKIKESQLSGYFTQEFMVEDMKNMMVDLNAKVLEIESKLTYMTGSRETITEECKLSSTLPQNQLRRRKGVTSSSSDNNNKTNESVGKMQLGEAPVETQCHSIELQEIHRPPSYTHLKERSNSHATTKSGDTPGCYFSNGCAGRDKQLITTKELKEFLTENRNGEHRLALNKSELQIAFTLLQNQAKIMSNALDDVYNKTKQDIGDLENLISSLLVCTDAESELDYRPTAQLKV